MITLRDAFDRTLRRIQMAGGTDVQTFSEETLLEIIRHKIHSLYKSAWWPTIMTHGEEHTLDGTLGIITGDLTNKIHDFTDIRYVYYEKEPAPLPIAPLFTNPALIHTACIAPFNDPAKIAKFYPVTLTGKTYWTYRTIPPIVNNEDDIIRLDEQLIILGSAYDYMNGLGTNPGEEDKLLVQYNALYTQLTKDLIPKTISSTSYESPSYPDRWWESSP